MRGITTRITKGSSIRSFLSRAVAPTPAAGAAWNFKGGGGDVNSLAGGGGRAAIPGPIPLRSGSRERESGVGGGKNGPISARVSPHHNCRPRGP